MDGQGLEFVNKWGLAPSLMWFSAEIWGSARCLSPFVHKLLGLVGHGLCPCGPDENVTRGNTGRASGTLRRVPNIVKHRLAGRGYPVNKVTVQACRS